MGREMFVAFNEFLSSSTSPVGDIRVAEAKEDTLKALMGERYSDKVKSFAANNAGCYIALWGEVDDSSPVLWLDSEGFPLSVFANNFAEFLSLIAYDTGAIYEVVSSCRYFTDDPANNSDPKKRFTPSYLKMLLEISQQNNSGHASLVEWLGQHGVEVAEDPVALVMAAMKDHPNVP